MKTKNLCLLSGLLILMSMPCVAYVEENLAYNEAETEWAYHSCEHSETLACPDGADNEQSPEVIMAHSPLFHPPYPPPYPILGQVCRNGGFYCYTPPLPLGSPCSCWTWLGVIWLSGYISTW